MPKTQGSAPSGAAPGIYQHTKLISVYCSPKYNTMAMALSTTFPKATIQYHPLVDIMTTNPMMPDTHSVWLDLPTRGLPNRGPFLKSVSAMISQCKQTKTPFVLILSKEDRIDGTVIAKLPLWKMILDTHDIHFQAVCGCHLPWRKRELHLQKYIYGHVTHLCQYLTVYVNNHILPKYQQNLGCLITKQ